MKFYKNGLFSKTTTTLEDENWNEVVMSKDEFLELKEKEKKLKESLREVRKLNEEKEELRNKFNSILNRNREEAKEKLEKLEEEYSLLKKQLEEKIFYLEKDNDKLNSQNLNLLRMNKERSNAERKIYPKKLHNGYVLLHQENYNKNYSFKVVGEIRGSSKIYRDNLPLYKYRLETPYLCNIELEFVKKLILEDMKKYYDLNYLSEIPRNSNFFETLKLHKYLLNLKISTSERFYHLEFSSNILIKIKES